MGVTLATGRHGGERGLRASLTWIRSLRDVFAYAAGIRPTGAFPQRCSMSRYSHRLPALLLAMACTAAWPALAQHHAHHPAAAPATQAAAPAIRYATDAPLRKGMADIRIAVGMLEHAGHGHLDAAQVRNLVAGIERSIGTIIAECKLAPEADAALHGIIGGLGQGIAALKEDPADMAPLAGMRAALDDYARMFDDPGVAPAASPAAMHHAS
jgi:hypothetical protein